MNLYLISAGSYHIINEEIAKITKNSTNIIKYDLNIDGVKGFLEEASYFSLFDEKKYIIINNSETLYNENPDIDLIIKYLDNPNSNSVLIFTVNSVLKNKPIIKYIEENGNLIIKENYSNKDLVKIINDILKENNKSMSYMGINKLIDLCQSNYDIILQELNKLFIYCDEKNIPDNILDEVVSNNQLIDNFKFSDAVINKNMALSFKYYDILKEAKVEVSLLIGLLASQYRLIYTVKVLNSQKYSKEAITKELKIHPYRVELALKNSFNYTEKDLTSKIHDLAELDVNLKSTPLNGYAGLEMFLLNI